MHALIEALIADISSLSDEFDALAVWYDRDLDPTLKLTPELRRKVKAAAVLMILMSPRYLKSAWCGDERAWFHEQIEDRAGDEGRVFVVRAVPTDDSVWPAFASSERAMGRGCLPVSRSPRRLLVRSSRGHPFWQPHPRPARRSLQQSRPSGLPDAPDFAAFLRDCKGTKLIGRFVGRRGGE